MFDANARWLENGTLFFASKGKDLLYCEMLEDDCKFPDVHIITSYSGEIHNLTLHECKNHKRSWRKGFLVYEGHISDGSFIGFIDKSMEKKARDIIGRM